MFQSSSPNSPAFILLPSYSLNGRAFSPSTTRRYPHAGCSNRAAGHRWCGVRCFNGRCQISGRDGKLADAGKTGAEATGCQHLDSILEEIHPSIDLPRLKLIEPDDNAARDQFAEDVARRNVVHSVRGIVETSRTIRKLVDECRLAVVGAVYDVSSGKVEFLVNEAIGLNQIQTVAAAGTAVNANT
jgi:Carbonic anhydrase